MKNVFLILMCFLFVGCAGIGPGKKSVEDLFEDAEMTAADEKLTAMTDYTTAKSQVPVSTDIMYYVYDPGGSDTGPTSYSITVQALFSYLATNTAVITGGVKTPLAGAAADFDDNFTGSYLYGGTYRVTTVGTLPLPEATVNMNFTIVVEVATGTTTITSLTGGTADTIIMNGLAAASDEDIESVDTIGAMCVFQYAAANYWMATCKGFTEVTPP